MRWTLWRGMDTLPTLGAQFSFSLQDHHLHISLSHRPSAGSAGSHRGPSGWQSWQGDHGQTWDSMEHPVPRCLHRAPPGWHWGLSHGQAGSSQPQWDGAMSVTRTAVIGGTQAWLGLLQADPMGFPLEQSFSGKLRVPICLLGATPMEKQPPDLWSCGGGCAQHTDPATLGARAGRSTGAPHGPAVMVQPRWDLQHGQDPTPTAAGAGQRAPRAG